MRPHANLLGTPPERLVVAARQVEDEAVRGERRLGASIAEHCDEDVCDIAKVHVPVLLVLPLRVRHVGFARIDHRCATVGLGRLLALEVSANDATMLTHHVVVRILRAIADAGRDRGECGLGQHDDVLARDAVLARVVAGDSFGQETHEAGLVHDLGADGGGVEGREGAGANDTDGHSESPKTLC